MENYQLSIDSKNENDIPIAHINEKNEKNTSHAVHLNGKVNSAKLKS